MPSYPVFGGRGSAASGASASGGGGSYSLERLQQLYNRLQRFRESDLDKDGGEAIVETVRQLTEAVIWGEQHDTRFFDFFCEKSILADFVRVLALAKAPKTVKTQLLQTLSILVQNLKRRTSYYYLLSNRHVNTLMGTKFDFDDEEILAYYITFMKSLAMRLDSETIKFFFIQHPEPTFPLYVEATRFFSHTDQMVRATVRTITLQVYKIDDEPMQRFILRHAVHSYFSRLALHLRDLWLRFDAAAKNARSEEDLVALQREHELQQDLLVYLSDVFALEKVELNEALADRLLNCAMLPVLLSGVIPQGVRPKDQRRRVLLPPVALFLLRQVLDIFSSPVLLEPLVSALLLPSLPAALAFSLPNCPRVGDQTPVGSLREDYVPNVIRGHFLSGLQSNEDGILLLSSAVVHGCLQRRHALPPTLLEAAGLAPAEDQGPDLEVLSLLLRILELEKATEHRPLTLRVFARVLADVLSHPAVAGFPAVRVEACSIVHSAVGVVARSLRALLTESPGDSGDWLIDVFAQEWDANAAPMADVARFCGNPRCLLPPELWRAAHEQKARAPEGASQEIQSLLGYLLLLRRLLAGLRPTPAAEQSESEFERHPGACWAGTTEEPSPLQVEGEAEGDFREGMSLDVGRLDRIVCGVASAKGKCTRHMLLHDFWLMLVQPDLTQPGWAVVRMLWPIRHAQCFIDRGDPRTLQVIVWGTAAPGGASQSVTFNFEDVQRCHAANVHLTNRRNDIRAKLRQKALDFVDAYCAWPHPEPDAAPEPDLSALSLECREEALEG